MKTLTESLRFLLTNRLFLTLLVLLLLQVNIYGQDTTLLKKAAKIDTSVLVIKRHSPLKAALFSAALPGLGQVYNKKYWKLPIIYAGLGTLGYFVGFNAKQWNIYREAYRLRVDQDPLTLDQFEGRYTESQLLTQKRYYKRNMDLLIIFTALVYALNIVDAAVDAHLFEFDVSDDLSMYIAPRLEYTAYRQNFTGLTFGIRL